MYKFDFTKKELEELKSKIYLSELQERILEYRLKDYSITKMAQLENISESSVSSQVKKIANKIKKIL